ncbi:hypothetical protein pEaSNUABM37_00083 [Erwinia phage pEa_SNUABM_37]|nr:hypothetical protein pEaSNUABM37_00083 [Erwinia phage pEa_SNUABM_37]QXO10553.1 hypothetical protein pEaSNUABM48_00083 [Erwinia phage pEa_SNUABM_48]
MLSKLYLRVYWSLHFYMRSHPLVTPGVLWCALIMFVLWTYNVVHFVSGLYHKRDEPTVIGQRVVKEFFYLPDSKGIVNLVADINKKDSK